MRNPHTLVNNSVPEHAALHKMCFSLFIPFFVFVDVFGCIFVHTHCAQVEMSSKIDANAKELGALQSKIVTLAKSIHVGDKMDAVDHVDVVRLEHDISAFRQAEASEDIGDSIEKDEQAQLVAMAKDARQYLNAITLKHEKADRILDLEWYLWNSIYIAVATFVIIKRKAIWENFTGPDAFFAKGLQHAQDRRSRSSQGGSRTRNQTGHSVSTSQGRGRTHLQAPTAYASDYSEASFDSVDGPISPSRQPSDEAIEHSKNQVVDHMKRVSLMAPHQQEVKKASRSNKDGNMSNLNNNPYENTGKPMESKYALKWLMKAHIGGRGRMK